MCGGCGDDHLGTVGGLNPPYFLPPFPSSQQPSLLGASSCSALLGQDSDGAVGMLLDVAVAQPKWDRAEG